MLVKFNGASKYHNLRVKELKRLANDGEFLEVDESRAKELFGHNKYFIVFAEPANQDEIDYREMVKAGFTEGLAKWRKLNECKAAAAKLELDEKSCDKPKRGRKKKVVNGPEDSEQG